MTASRAAENRANSGTGRRSRRRNGRGLDPCHWGMNNSYMKQTANTPHFTVSLIHAAASVNDRLEAALETEGLSVAKQSALTQLAIAEEPLTRSDLAARLSCVGSNNTGLVDRRAAAGLVRRSAEQRGRRRL